MILDFRIRLYKNYHCGRVEFIKDGNDKAEEIYCQVKIIGCGHGRLERCDEQILFYLDIPAIGNSRTSEYQGASRTQVTVESLIVSNQSSLTALHSAYLYGVIRWILGV